jgi:adenine-specific DNA-methyltransferase
MAKRSRLELTWIGKDERPRLEPRILIEDPTLSHVAAAKSENDIFDNVLIKGDNLLALKALEAEYTSKVKCIFIDPPYNTGSAFEHYQDGLEHSLWLSMMLNRLEILRKLLTDDGSIWITIDDNEAHYLKVLCDEVFGRASFVSSAVWENFYGRSNAAAISPSHNYVLIYAPLGQQWKYKRNLLPRDDAASSKYRNPDNDTRGPWRLGPIFAAEERHEGLMYSIQTPSGREVRPPKGSHWRMTEPDFWKMVREGRIVFGSQGDNNPAVKLYLSEVQAGMVPRTWWPHNEVGHSQEAKREVQALYSDGAPFDTPKPERLVHRALQIATNPGDLVLDSFAGSGTTGAVAHKMGRRWIMVELGDHAVTHIVPRLKKVVDGGEPGGVTEATGWQGGGGFRFYRLAPSLLSTDKWGNWVISKNFNAPMLAEAICKLMGFTYAPSQDKAEYWRHGHSSERDFIYVTTASLTQAQLRSICDDVGSDRTLLICCKAFNARASEFDNLTIKKIPHAVLSRCEWGKDDYSLRIAALPEREPEGDPLSAPAASPAKPGRRRKTADPQPSFLDDGEA